MAFSPDTSLLASFDQEWPIDAINGAFNISGNFTTVPGRFGNAVALNGASFDISALDSLSSSFTLGFWLKPLNLGVVTNPNTNATQPLKMALFTKSSPSYSAITKQTTLSSEKFSVWEETQADGTNVLKIRVSGATSAILTSSPYSAGTFHHFWIVYNGNNDEELPLPFPFPIGYSYLAMFIDGEADTGAVLTGDVPSSLNSSTSHFYINNSIDGYAFETIRNFGFLDDLVIFSTSRILKTDLFRALDLGISYITDMDLIDDDEATFGTIFNDTSTIQINSICGNRGSVYVGRSDGQLLKGSRVLWESRRDFSNSNEKDCLSIVTRSSTDNYVIQNGTLKVTNAIIRV
jgi:hypothetical protein